MSGGRRRIRTTGIRHGHPVKRRLDGPCGQTLVTAMRGRGQRCADALIVAQNRGDALLHGKGRAIEAGERAVRMAEEAQRREQAFDGRDKRGWRGFGLVCIGLAQRQKVGQKFQNGFRIAGNVDAIRQDLTLEFAAEIAGGLRQAGGGDGQ